MQYDHKIDPDFSPITYYGKLALRLPGLISASGDALTEVVFSASEPSPPATYRWRPQQGRVEVALRDMTARTKSLNAELEPRLCQLPSSEYGLIQFIRSHGTPVDEQSNEWLIKLTKKISEIQGFANEQTDQATISITLRIKLLDPASGLPPPIDWPDFSAMPNARPNPPWRLPADDS